MDNYSFFSIDRLVEFGMGMAVAQQMIKTMNQSMISMYVPGATNQMEKSQQQFFYAIIETKQAGPFSEQELARLIAEKKIVKETYVWMPSLSSWKMADQVPEVLKLVALAPPPFNPNP
ncbi:DUF4339 domain-containing protein [Gelidibacter gilvus]|uniref:DUF4339 domain-containing protein n=1 Tax=Gelidibacter gilvus TaxID=59602 RepID=A0A4Q0XHP5_9FLAO|nr:DUF4339 domain-containing protein [Gelidibacter gilvus]RXJ51105.1 DUF4339 domain-containing protein [Gelidibacter gilvus]